MVLFWGIGPLLVNPGVCPPGQHLDSHLEGAPLQWSAPIPVGGVLRLPCVGSGDGVGDCHDAASLPRERLFISP